MYVLCTDVQIVQPPINKVVVVAAADLVPTTAANQDVGAVAAQQLVIVVAADEDVVGAVAHELIFPIATHQDIGPITVVQP